jgi:hypothetical protein
MSDLGKNISEWVASDETKDWAKRKIEGFPGLYLVKMPAKKDVPANPALEINPADQFGNPTKRRGIYIRATAEMQAVADLFGGKIPKPIQTLCDALFDGATVVQDAADMLVIA